MGAFSYIWLIFYGKCREIYIYHTWILWVVLQQYTHTIPYYQIIKERIWWSKLPVVVMSLSLGHDSPEYVISHSTWREYVRWSVLKPTISIHLAGYQRIKDDLYQQNV